MSSAKISVIIPTRNRANFISQTLNCFINQTLKPYEIIVVDNQSTDNTEKIIKDNFKDKVIYVKNNGNITPGAGRNYGLSIATGNYIQFFDSDDVLTKNKLEQQAKILENNSVSQGVFCPYVHAIEKNGKWNQTDCILQYKPLNIKNISTKMLKGFFLPVWTFLFRADFIKQNNPWPDDLFAYEDYYYLFSLFKNGLNPLHTNSCCVFYRMHENQITGNDFTNANRDKDKVECLNRILKNFNLSSFEKNIAKTIIARVTNNFDDFSKFKFNFVNKYLRIENKIHRIITSTDWTLNHSPEKNKEIFNSYCALL